MDPPYQRYTDSVRLSREDVADPPCQRSIDSVSREEYEALQAEIKQMKRTMAELVERHNAGVTENVSDDAEDPTPTPPATCTETIKAKTKELYESQATAVVQMVSSMDLLSQFSLNTAFLIAAASVIAKFLFAFFYTTTTTAQCTPTKTILDGDWSAQTYQDLFNTETRQYLCTTHYLDQYQFAVGNQNERQKTDPLFGFEEPFVDLSTFEYTWVWTAFKGGVLRSTAFDNWERLAFKQGDETYFVSDCARECAKRDAPYGMYAINGQYQEEECLCGFSTWNDTCLAHYTGDAEHCVVWYGDLYEYFLWNDTKFSTNFLLFSKYDTPEQFRECSQEEVETLCQTDILEEEQSKPPKVQWDGYIDDDDASIPDGMYWKHCSLNGFSCSDYGHDQCEPYGHVCGETGYEDGGWDERQCHGIVSVTYITCPAVHVILGSSLGYLSYLELVLVTLLACLALFMRGENPVHVFKENAKILAYQVAREQVNKKLAKYQGDINETLTKTEKGKRTSEKVNLIYAATLEQEGLQGTLELSAPAPAPTEAPSSPVSPTPILQSGQDTGGADVAGADEDVKELDDGGIKEVVIVESFDDVAHC
ncbi:expressed unknown protein [Seminavis robusta]|uniref:Uncharacterized protein n=1 Tax=Seminavis robusta TaxID=568900 RepID=A0A9N8HR07_9STRA|nr:expressed unknown protein [Seminavis robusta]|eukprot:Sro1213_g252960.1 n/a (593) ;mRNA; f:9329-11199